MASVLVDSNVILDVVNEDRKWLQVVPYSPRTFGESHTLIINPIIYGEISIGFDRIGPRSNAAEEFSVVGLAVGGGILAGKSRLNTVKSGGARRSPLPDFYIGAHAAVGRLTLLTRDEKRYKHIFQSLR